MRELASTSLPDGADVPLERELRRGTRNQLANRSAGLNLSEAELSSNLTALLNLTNSSFFFDRPSQSRQLSPTEAMELLLNLSAPGEVLSLQSRSLDLPQVRANQSAAAYSWANGSAWSNGTWREAHLPAGSLALSTLWTSLDYDGSSARPQNGFPTQCGQKNLDVLAERVQSQVTMCCQKQQCEDTPGWNMFGYSCADLNKWGMCRLGAFTVKYDWMYRWSWQFNYPEQNCCACGKTECQGDGAECGRREQAYCASLHQLGLQGCELNCRHMWELSCVRWTEIHGERCPMCNDMTYEWERLPDGRHRDRIDNPTPPGARPIVFPCFQRKTVRPAPLRTRAPDGCRP